MTDQKRFPNISLTIDKNIYLVEFDDFIQPANSNYPTTILKGTLRGVLQSIIQSIPTNYDFSLHELKMKYLGKALDYREEKGKYLFYASLSRIFELKRHEGSDVVEKVKILPADKGNACENCFSQYGKVYSFEDAYKYMPLPNKKCTNWICRCTFTTIIKND